jgi:hypothetical protein
VAKTSGSRFVGLLAAVALTLALAGCLKMNVDLTVTPQDTVNGTMILGIDKSVAAMSGQSEEQLRKQFTDAAPTAAPGTKVEPYADDTYIGSKITFTELPLADLNKDSSRDQLRIVHDQEAGTYTVSGELDLSRLSANDPMGAAFARTLDVRIAITLPGDVTEHNGTLDGRTVTWIAKPGEKLTMHAVSEEASAIAWVPVLAIGIPTLLVIAALVAWLVFRRRAAAPQPPVEPAPAPATDPWQTANLEAEQRSQPDGEPGPGHD